MCDKEYIDRLTAARCLAKIRLGWEEAVCSQDLDDVKGSVGLLLNDVEEAIGFEPGEISELVFQEVEVR